MSIPLSPAHAIVLADSAYATRATSRPVFDATMAAGSSGSWFNIASSSIFTGTTGLSSGATTNFGYCAFGKSPARQGECLISVRGTATLHDALTDLKYAGARGPGGFTVHNGFN